MKTWVVVLCCLFSFTSTLAQRSGQKYPMVKIATLAKATSDTVRLKAYVFDVYVCPPCPEGAQCKPCMENHATVVEEEPVDPMKVPLDRRVRIFTERSDSLKTGKRYLFTVTFRNKKTSPEANVTLVSFRLL